MNQQLSKQELAEKVFYCVNGNLIIKREIIKGNEHIFYCPLEEKVCEYQGDGIELRGSLFYKCIHFKE